MHLRPKLSLRAILIVLLAYFCTYQARFLYDLYRDFTFKYSSPGFGIGHPWPTVATWIGSEARAAGLALGDRITSLDGKPLVGLSDQYRAVRTRRPGESVSLTYERNGLHSTLESG